MHAGLQAGLRTARVAAAGPVDDACGVGIRTATAAEILGISASTLRTWERRYGYPAPLRTSGGQRLYDRAEVEALRDAFAETGHAASAVALARGRGGSTPPSVTRLCSALGAYDEEQADRVLAEALAGAGLEATLEELLLPAVDALASEGEPPGGAWSGLSGGSPEHALAVRWAAGWIAAQRRLVAPAFRADGILALDAGGPDVLHVAALEVALRRAGLRVLVLPVTLDPARLQRAITVLDPTLVVLGGRGAELDVVGRAVHASRRARGERVAVCDFRGAVSGATTVPRVGPGLRAARDAILARVAERPLDVPEVAPAAHRGLRVVS